MKEDVLKAIAEPKKTEAPQPTPAQPASTESSPSRARQSPPKTRPVRNASG